MTEKEAKQICIKRLWTIEEVFHLRLSCEKSTWISVYLHNSSGKIEKTLFSAKSYKELLELINAFYNGLELHNAIEFYQTKKECEK